LIYDKLISNTSDDLCGCLICKIEDKIIMFSHIPANLDYYSNHDNKYISTIKVLDHIFKKLNCDINIHGHTHSRSIQDSRFINVSCENIGFTPIKLGDLLNKVK
jgi:calcineurin-like phosphoesterase family protein